MTAPAHPDRQGTREELAAAAIAAAGCRRDQGPVGVPFCAAHDDLGNPPWDRCRWHEALELLLPVVERLCDQRAAEAVGRVEAVADFVHECSEGIAPSWARVYLDIERRIRVAIEEPR